MTNKPIKTHHFIMIAQHTLVGLLSFVFSTATFANPVLAPTSSQNVGQFSVQQNGNTTTINQTSQKAIINWQSFNIGSQEQTHFQQPTGGVALNRINPSQGVSQIYGRLTASGQIILVNPAGIFFAPGSYVNVGGLIATTSNISNEDFLNNYYRFTKDANYNGAIINQGTIIAANNGLIALIGGAVSNEGYIQANYGHAILASGDAFTMTFAGNDLVSFAVESGVHTRAKDKDGRTLNNGVSNTGSIYANQILISAKDAAGVLDNVIDMHGIAQTTGVSDGAKPGDGEIILLGDIDKGVVKVAGTLNASGKTGGNISITGYNILLDKTAELNASGTNGSGNILIGGDYQGTGSTPHANALIMQDGARIYADAITHGNGGKVILWSDQYTNVSGFISARGGSEYGNGGLVETSGKQILSLGAITVDTTAAHGKVGTWLLDPTNIYIAANQTNATTAGMTGTDTSADSSSPPTFAASGAVQDSLLLTSTLNAALASSNILVTTTNASGTGLGNINIVDPISWSSANTLTLTAANNITINAAITTGAAGSGLILNAAGSVTQTAAIGGSGSVTKQGSGSAIFSLANTYTGGTTINSGFLSARHVNALGSGDVLVNSGGTLKVGTSSGSPLANNVTINGNGAPTTGGALTGDALANYDNYYSGTLTLGSSAQIGADVGAVNIFFLTSTNPVTGNGFNLTIGGNGGGQLSAPINTGTGTLTINPNSSWTFLGSSTYSGITTINNTGVSAYSATNPFGTGDITINGAFGQLALSNSALTNNIIINSPGVSLDNPALSAFNTSTSTISGLITLGQSTIIGAMGGSTLNLTNTGNITGSGLNLTVASSDGLGGAPGVGAVNIASNITTGTGALTLSNSSFTASSSLLLTLTGTNTYSGNTTINSETTLSIGNGGTTGTVAGNIINNNALIFNRSNNYTFSNTISGTGTLTKASGGVLTLTASNSYTGATAITGGTLSINTLANGGTNSPIGATAATTPITLSGSGIFSYTGGAGSTNRQFATSGTGGSINASAAGTLTLSGAIANNGSALTFNTNTGNITASGIISGSGNLVKTGTGTLTLSGANTYTGNTSINAGVLLAASNLGNSAGTVTVASGATLQVNGNTISNPLTLNGSGAAGSYGALETLLSAFATTYAGLITLGSDATIATNSTLTLSNSGTITGSGFNLTLTGGPNGGTGYLNSILGTGTGSLTLSGTGSTNTQWWITNANTYTGGTTLQNRSEVFLQHTNALGTSGAITVNNGGSLVIAFNGGTLANASTLTLNGAGGQFNGALALWSGGSNTLNNPIVLSGNTTIRGTGGGGSVSLNLTGDINTNGNTLRFSNGGTGLVNTFTASGVISGTGGVIVDVYYLTLSNDNTYTGGTTLNSLNDAANYYGSLQIGNGGATGSVVGTILNNGNLTFYKSTNFTLPNTISGTGTLAQGGTGTLTISNVNSYTGSTTVSGGVLSINSIGDAGTNTAIGNSSTAIQLYGGTLQYTGTGHSSARAIITGNTGSAIDASGSGALVLSGGISSFASYGITLTGTGLATQSGVINNTTGAVTKSGSGTWTLSNAANTYTGATSITGGTLSVGTLANGGVNSSLGATAAATPIALSNGGILSYTGGTVSTNRQFSTSGTGGTIQSTAAGLLTLSGNIANAGTSLTFDTNTGNITASGVISGAGNLIKSSSGTLTLGNAANTYTGSTSITGGMLSFGVIANGGTNSSLGATAAATPIAISGSGILSYTGGIASSNRQFSISGAGGTIQATTSGELTLSGAINNAGTALTFDTNTGNITASSLIGGAGNLIKSGTGTLTLSGANTYNGNTTINTGILIASNNTALGNAASAVTVISGGTLRIAAGISLANPLTLNGTGATGSNGALDTTSFLTAATISGLITLGSNTTIGSSGNLNITNTGTITGSGYNLTLSGFAGSGTINSVIGTNGGSLIVSGFNSRWILTNANTYTGGTNVQNSELIAQNANALGTTGAITVSNGGSLNLQFTGTLANTSTLTLSGNGGGGSNGALMSSAGNIATLNNPIVLASDSTIFPVNSPSALILAGDISGTGGVTIQGPGGGTVTFSGNNQYTGATVVSASRLILNSVNALGNGTNNTSSVSLLNGNLTINTSLTASPNMTINTGTISLSSGNTYNYSGLLTLTGNATIDSSGTLNITNTGTITGSGFTLFLTGGGSGTGSISSIIGIGSGTVALTGGSWTLSGANTYTGSTNIVNSTLIAANASALGSTAGGTTISTSATLIINGVAIGAESVAFNSTNGTLTGAGTSSLSGAITLGTSSTISANAGANFTLTGGITGTNTNLTLTGAGSGVFDTGIIATGSGTLTKSGSGTWTLNNANTYTGLTTVSAGTLVAGNATALGTTAAGTSVTNGATLNINGVAIGAEAMTINGSGVSGSGALVGNGTSSLAGLITLGSASTIAANSGTLTLSNTGTITGATFGLTLTGAGNGSIASVIGTTSGTLIKDGTGAWTLGGASTYSGGTTIRSGSLTAVTSSSAFGTGAITLGNTSGNADASLLIATNGLNIANAITLASGTSGTLKLANTGSGVSATFSGAITGTNNLTVSNDSTASSRLTLSGAAINNSGTLNLTFTNNGGNSIDRIAINKAIGSNVTAINAIGDGTSDGGSYNAIYGNITVNPAGTIISQNSYLEIRGNINGTGNLILNGTYGMSFFGTSINHVGAIINNNPNVYIGNTIGANVTSYTQTGNDSVASLASISGNSYTGGSFILAGMLIGSASNAFGTGAITLGNSSGGANNATLVVGDSISTTYNNPIILAANTTGTLSIQATGTAAPLATKTLIGGVTGNNNLTIINTDGSMTFSGAAINNNGSVNINFSDDAVIFSGGLGANVSSLNLNSTSSTVTVSGLVNVNAGGTTFNNASSGLLSITGGMSGSGNVVLNNNTAIANNITVSGADVNHTGSLSNTGSGSGSVLISANIGSNVSTVTQNSNTSTLILTGTNTYNTTNITSGTLRIGNAGTTGTPGLGTITNNGNIIFDRTNSLTVNNAIIGTGNLNQQGSGTTILTNSNSYTGSTTINAGVLSINSIGNAGTNTALGNSSTAINLGAGTLQYTGTGHSSSRAITLTASGGTIDASGSGTLTLSGNVTGSGNNLILTGSGNATASGSINTTTGTLTKNGSGIWTLANANTYSGGTTINAGTIIPSSADALGSTGIITINAGGTLNIIQNSPTAGGINNNSNIIINGSGVGGAGALLSSVGNGSVGPFTQGILSNQIILGSDAKIGNNGNLLILFGNINTAGHQLTLASSGVNSGITINTNISGSGGLTVANDPTGYVLFSVNQNTNTYTGPTIINSGLLIASSYEAFGDGTSNTSSVTVANGGQLELYYPTYAAAPVTTMSGAGPDGSGALIYNGTSTSEYNGQITLSGDTTFGSKNFSGSMTLRGGIINNGYTLTIANTVVREYGSITGTGGLTTSTAGGIYLFGNNQYTGATTINSNSIVVAKTAGALGDGTLNTSAVTVANGGSLYFENAALIATPNVTISGGGRFGEGAIFGSVGTSSFGGLITLAGASVIGADATLNITSSGNISGSGYDLTLAVNGTGSIASVIGTGTGSLTKSGPGTWTLSGANTFTGSTTIIGGTLSINTIGDAGTNTALGNTSSAITIGTGVLRYTGTGHTSNRAINITTSSAVVNASGTGTLTLTGGVSGTNTNFTLTGTGSGVLNTGSIATGSGTLTKSGTGTWTLNNANTYTGLTTISAGTLVAGNATALGTTAAGTSITNGATLNINGVAVGAEAITINGSGVSGAGALVGNGTSSLAGLITLGSASTIAANSGTLTLSNTGTITGATFGLTLTGAGNGSIASVIGTTSGSLTKSGAGTWTLSNSANTYTGATSITNGTLSIATIANGGLNSSLGAAAAATPIAISGGGVLQYTGGANAMDRTFTLSGTGGTIRSTTAAMTLSGAINNTGTTLTFDNATGNITASGIISGTGNVTKTGTGTTVLSNANTFTGTTTVSGGILQLGNINALGSGATQSSLISIASGGKLTLNFGSSGTLANSSTIQINGAGNDGFGAIGNSAASTATVNNAIVLMGNTTIGGFGSELNLFGNITENTAGLSLTKAGNSFVHLGGNNSFTGATVINGGALIMTSANALGTGATQSSSITVNNGASIYFENAMTFGNTNTLTISGSGVASPLGVISFAVPGSGSVTLNNPIVLAGNSEIGVSNGGGANNLILNGNISGAFSLTKSGLIALTLNGNNTYSGGTILNGNVFGRILVTNPAGLGTGNISINNGGILGINLNNAALLNTNTISISGSAILLENGTGTVTMSNPINTGSASLSINSGTASSNFVIAGNISSSNGGLSVNNYTSLGALNGNVTITGVIGNGSGSINKFGSGTTLYLTNNNTYSGATNVSAGTLSVSSPNALGDTTGTTSVASGATLEINNTALGAETIFLGSAGVGSATLIGSGNASYAGDVNMQFASFFDGTGSLTLTGQIIGAGITMNKNGSGTLVIAGTNNSTGAMNINAGTLQIGNGLTSGNTSIGATITNNAALVFDRSDALTVNNVITGTGTLTQAGSGTTILVGANNYSGSTFINSGTLQVGNGGTIGAVGSGAIINNNNLTYNRSDIVTLASVMTGTGSFTQAGSGTVILTGDNLNSGGTTIASGTLQLGNGGSTGSVVGNIVDNGALVFNTSNNFTHNSVISGSGSVTQAGTGVITLNGNNTFDGALNINSGSLVITNANAMGSTLGSTTLNNGATLTIAGVTIGSEGLTLNGGTFGGSGTAAFGGAITLNADVDISNNGGTFTLNSTLNNPHALTFNGAGTTVLNGAIGTGGVGTELTSVTANTNLVVGGGAINTSGNQSYQSVVTTNDTVFTSSGAGANSIAFNGNLSGGNNISLAGSNAGGSYTFTIGNITANNVDVSATAGATNNVFNLNTGGTQNFNATSSNAGTVTGVATVAGNFTYNNMQNINGGSGADNFIVNGGSFGNINGGAGNNSLTGGNVVNTWHVTSANGGTATGVSGTFANIQNLNGGNNADNFTLAGGTVSGNINGGAGNNSMTADNVVNTWSVTSANGGTVTGVGGTFANIQNLIGGSNADNFTLAGGTISGNINGGAGINGLTADNVNNTWTISSTNGGTVTGVGGTFANIQNLTGGSGSDTFIFGVAGILNGNINGGLGNNTLIGANTNNLWTINANNGGTFSSMTGSFANIQNLTGGNTTDNFNFNPGATISGIVDGGDSIDRGNSINFNTYSTVLLLYLSAPVVPHVFEAGGVYNASTRLANFVRVQQSIGNNIGYIILPNVPGITVSRLPGDPNPLNGMIDDPFYYLGWIVGNPPPVAPVTPSPSPYIAPIVNQPNTNQNNNNNNNSTNYIDPYGNTDTTDYSIINNTYTEPLLNTTTVKYGSTCTNFTP